MPGLSPRRVDTKTVSRATDTRPLPSLSRVRASVQSLYSRSRLSRKVTRARSGWILTRSVYLPVAGRDRLGLYGAYVLWYDVARHLRAHVVSVCFCLASSAPGSCFVWSVITVFLLLPLSKHKSAQHLAIAGA